MSGANQALTTAQVTYRNRWNRKVYVAEVSSCDNIRRILQSPHSRLT